MDRKDDERENEEFEPLDSFFAPIEDVEWPEEQGRPEPPEGRKPEPGPPAGGTDDGLDEELVLPDISDDPLAGIEEEVRGPEKADLPPTAEPTASGGPSEPTAELSGRGWEELRLDVGEGGETWREDAEAAMTEAGPAYPEAESEDELTLEDLKTPPPEYADLPGPQDAQPEEPPAFPPEPPISEEVAASAAEPEPELEALEAAAEHFAESLRDEPPVPRAMGGGGPEEPGITPTPQEVEQDLLSDLDRRPAPPPPVTVGVSDTLGGPSWQEPTSEEVTAAPSRPPSGGRNLPLAFLSGIVLVGIGILAIALGKAAFTVVAGAVIVLAQGELYAALHRRGYQPATALGLVFGGLVSAASYLRGEGGALAMFVLGSVFTFLWFMAVPAKSRQNVLLNIATTLLPLGYVALLGGYVMVILAMTGGKTLMLSVVGLAVGYDIAAFAIGSLWGSRPLAPSISPRKSWEGAIGATLILLLVSVALIASLNSPIGTVGRAIGLALIISVAAPLGDLAESLLKRDLGVKDMGSLIPGHGGILDRIDSILFAAPAAFYFFRLILS